MTAYIGCVLFGLIFFFMHAHANGKLGTKMGETLDWIHTYAPFSYILIFITLVAPIVSFQIMHSWPKHVEPENPMAKYRRGDDVVQDD